MIINYLTDSTIILEKKMKIFLVVKNSSKNRKSTIKQEVVRIMIFFFTYYIRIVCAV